MNTQIHEYAILHFYILKASHILSIHCVHTCMLSFLCIQLEMSCGFFGLEAINDLLLSLSLLSPFFQPLSLSRLLPHAVTLLLYRTHLLFYCAASPNTPYYNAFSVVLQMFFSPSLSYPKNQRTQTYVFAVV